MPQDPPSGGDSARGDLTRQRLLETATEIFAQNAFDSVRTRMLADAAGVNQAAIPYYFGGKEGLYLAVAERIAEELGEQTSGLRHQAEEILRRDPPAGRDDIARTLGLVLYGFARSSLERPGQSSRIAFIMREQLHPSKAFDLIYDRAMEPLHRTVSALIARLREQPETDQRCVLHAHALIGQVIIFIAARTALLRRLGVAQLQSSQIEEIAELVSTLSTAPFIADTATTLLPPDAASANPTDRR